MGTESPEEAARLLLSRGNGEANALALAYRADLFERHLSPATVNRRLAALRSLVKLGRTIGLVPWDLDVEGVKSRQYRDTKGPGRDGIGHLLTELGKRRGAKGKRDLALVRLMYDRGLRRGEVVALDLSDLDLAAGTVSVLGKGWTERETLTLPPQTVEALSRWLAVRGDAPGPLFTNFDRALKGERLTGRSVARVLASLGRALGLVLRPHGLRHASITDALDATRGDVRAVQRFSRHRDVRVLQAYDDNRTDLGGEVARLVAGRADAAGTVSKNRRNGVEMLWKADDARAATVNFVALHEGCRFTAHELAGQLGALAAHVRPVLEELVSDGLLAKSGDVYFRPLR